MNKLLFLTVVLLFGLSAKAQVTFKATAEKVVEVGEMFRLTFSVNAQATGFRASKINDFRTIAGPSSSTSQSYSIVNGKASQSIETAYTYTLLAEKEGKFSIPAALITVDGKTYTSNELQIEVVKTGGSATNSSDTNGKNPAPAEISSEDLFLNVSFNKSEVYQGEPIVATVKIYAKNAELRDLGALSPAYTGFWRHDLPTPSRITLEREKLNGKIFQSGLLRQDLLIPQSSGKLTIPPMEIEAIYQYKVGQQRDFFGRIVDMYDSKQTTVKSSTKTITVKPLPPNKPADFSGLVGTNFTISAELTNENIKTDEGTTLKITVSGNGNIKLYDMPALSFADGLDAYPPEGKDNTTVTSAGTSGKKTFSYFILARKPGTYTLPAVTISYFDPQSASYKTITTKEFKLNVEKGANYSESAASVVTPNSAQSEVKDLDTDIRYLKTDVSLNKKDTYFAGSALFYSLFPLLFGAFIIPVFIYRNRIKRNADVVATKNRLAAKISQQRLRKAGEYLKLNQKTEFYKEILTALWGYVSDKLTIQASELSKQTISERFDNEELSSRIVQILETCEYAQYAPVSADEQPDSVFEKAKTIILDTEKYFSEKAKS